MERNLFEITKTISAPEFVWGIGGGEWAIQTREGYVMALSGLPTTWHQHIKVFVDAEGFYVVLGFDYRPGYSPLWVGEFHPDNGSYPNWNWVNLPWPLPFPLPKFVEQPGFYNALIEMADVWRQ